MWFALVIRDKVRVLVPSHEIALDDIVIEYRKVEGGIR